VKKISLDLDPITSANYQIRWEPGYCTTPPNTHWYVDFDIGSYQGGSSGSPLFNADHRIVGQLHGGAPRCEHPVIALYGRFDKSWTGGETNDTRLSNWLDPINSGALCLYTIYSTSATLSGPTLVCSAGASYTVNNVPPNCALYWENGPNLTRISAQGSNPCTFSSTGSGPGWIRVKIKTNSDNSYVTLLHNVWSGVPQVQVTGPSEGCVGNSYTYYEYPAEYSNPTSFEWTLSPPYEGNTIYGYGYWANAVFYWPYEEYYQIGCTAQNACGTGIMGTTYIYIYNCGYGYSVSPNPASTEVNITVTKVGSDNRSDLDLNNTVFDVSIYDMYGIKHIQKKYSGDKFTIPVYNLKDGNYIIQIDNDKKSSNLQLVIKH